MNEFWLNQLEVQLKTFVLLGSQLLIAWMFADGWHFGWTNSLLLVVLLSLTVNDARQRPAGGLEK